VADAMRRRRQWRWTWPAHFRLTLVFEPAVGNDHLPRIERIRQSLRSQYADGRISLDTFERRMERALEREC
jgi:hypothetical protein